MDKIAAQCHFGIAECSGLLGRVPQDARHRGGISVETIKVFTSRKDFFIYMKNPHFIGANDVTL